jgi:excisionase family DNA binding protein
MRKVRLLSPEEIKQLLACPVMKPRQASLVFGINRNKLYRMMGDGTLPFVQLGQSRLIRTEILQSITTPPQAAE